MNMKNNNWPTGVKLCEELGISPEWLASLRNGGACPLIDPPKKMPLKGKKRGFTWVYHPRVKEQIKEIKKRFEQGISVSQQKREKLIEDPALALPCSMSQMFLGRLLYLFLLQRRILLEKKGSLLGVLGASLILLC